MEADTAIALAEVFRRVIAWVEQCPDRCEAAGYWRRRDDIEDLAIDLAEALQLLQEQHGMQPLVAIPALRTLSLRGLVRITPELRISLTMPVVAVT